MKKKKDVRFSSCHCAFWIVFYTCIAFNQNVIYWTETLHKKTHENFHLQKKKTCNFPAVIAIFDCALRLHTLRIKRVYWTKTLYKKKIMKIFTAKKEHAIFLNCVLRSHSSWLKIRYTAQKPCIKKESMQIFNLPPPPFGRGGLGVFAFHDVPCRRFAPKFFVFKVHLFFTWRQVSRDPRRSSMGFYFIDSCAWTFRVVIIS